MTGKEAKAMTAEEIGLELKRLRDRLYSLRTQAVTEKVEDNSQFEKIRRDIARLMGERRSRQPGRAPKAPKVDAPAAARTEKPAKKPAKTSTKTAGAKDGKPAGRTKKAPAKAKE